LTVTVTILVPGFGDNTGKVRGLETFLGRQAIQTCVISPQPSSGSIGIDGLAEQLAKSIEQKLPAETRLNFVGFSMGGLICRAYIQRLGGLARTERLITIATPHQGTWAAYTYNRPACVQMRPGSRFLRELNHDLAPLRQLRFTSIWTPLDLTILPSTSSYLPVGTMVPIVAPFHRTLLEDKRILSTIATHLQKSLVQ
jgi:triacylglycerol lipase